MVRTELRGGKGGGADRLTRGATDRRLLYRRECGRRRGDSIATNRHAPLLYGRDGRGLVLSDDRGLARCDRTEALGERKRDADISKGDIGGWAGREAAGEGAVRELRTVGAGKLLYGTRDRPRGVLNRITIKEPAKTNQDDKRDTKE